MMRGFRFAAVIAAAARWTWWSGTAALLSASLTPAAAQNTVDCGIFSKDFLIVTFRITGGGTSTEGGLTVTVRDDFSGEIHFRKNVPGAECAQPDEVKPFQLRHHYEATGNGFERTIDLGGITSLAGPNVPLWAGGVDPISRTWHLAATGAFPGTEVTTYQGQPPERISLAALPWAPEGLDEEGITLIPNLSIPGKNQNGATIRRTLTSNIYPGLQWTVLVTVRGRDPVKIDPCYVYASIVGCEDQTLGESIPVTGIPFDLYYRSDRFGLPAAKGGWSYRALSVGGWSLAVHHSWDPATKTLYLGDGTIHGPGLEPVPAEGAGPPGAIFVPARDGSEVFLFDASGRHLKTLDAITGFLRYEFSYRASGGLSAIRDPFDRKITIERDATGRPTALVAPGGDRTLLATNARGLLTTVTNSAGHAYRLAYSLEGRLTSFTDPLNQTHRYVYDPAGRLVRDLSSAGTAFTLSRKATRSGTAVIVTDAAGVATVFATSETDGERMRSIAFANGTRTVAQTSGPQTSVTMPDGGAFTVTEAADPTWGSAGPPQEVTFTTPAGISRSVTTTVTAAPTIAGNTFPAPGREILTSVDGNAFRSTYRAETRTLTLTSPLGRTYSVQYDHKGLPLAFSRSGVAPVRLVHDGQGQLTEARSGDAGEERRIRFSYDVKGRLTALTDPLDRARRFTYDGLNRLVTQSFGGAETRYTYDALGRTTAYQPPSRPEHRVQYMPTGEVAAYLPPSVTGSAERTAYDYTAAGSLTAVTRLDGRAVRITRNAADQATAAATSAGVLRIERDPETGRVSRAMSPSGVSTQFTYDGPLLTSIAYSGGVTGTVTMQYGPSARLQTVAVAGGGEYPYEYDDDGLLIRAGEQVFTRDAESGLLVASTLRALRAEWKYSTFGEPIAHTEGVGGHPLYEVGYERDALGRIVRKSETAGGDAGIEEYEYDGAGRLARVVRDGREYARYEYDANGNRTRTTYADADLSATYDDRDRLLARGDVTFAYTGHGELVSRTRGSEVTAFDFDELSELRSVRTAAGRTIEYLTDADGRRVGRKVDGSLQEGFLYDADGSLVAWLDVNGAIRATFIYGRRRHVPEAMLRDGVLYRLVTDHVGSVRLVVNVTSGEVAQRLDYDPFGRILQNTDPGFQPFGFAGGLLDPHTGLLRFWLRDYDPETGRWISPDPLYFAAGATNFYAYAGNDPVNRSDPSGLWSAELSFGWGSVSVTWQEGVGVSGSIAIGAASPGGSVSPGGEAFVPADVESADFWSRDTKVTIEGKGEAGFGPFGGASVTLGLEQQADRYGIRCGPWTPFAKGEVCVLGVCADTEGQVKADVGKISEIKQGGSRPGKFGMSGEAVVKLEALIWSFR